MMVKTKIGPGSGASFFLVRAEKITVVQAGWLTLEGDFKAVGRERQSHELGFQRIHVKGISHFWLVYSFIHVQ